MNAFPAGQAVILNLRSKLMDQIHAVMRLKRYFIHPVRTWCNWIPSPHSILTLFIINCALLPVSAQTTRGSDFDLFQLFGKFTGKTVLCPSTLPKLPLSSIEDSNGPASADQNEIINRMKAKFAEAGLEVIPDGELFVWIMPAGLSNSSVMKLIQRIPRPASRTEKSVDSGASLPAGAINLIRAPIDQVLAIYADLRQRVVLRPAMLPVPGISLQTQTPLTREEVSYALNMVLLFNGLVVKDDGEKFVQIIPAKMEKQIQPAAPAPDESEPLIEPSEIPRIGFLQRSSAKPVPPIAATLLAYYAALTQEKPLPENQIGGVRTFFEVNLPLRKNELLYAITTTMALNGLKIVKEADGIRLERINP